MTDTHQLRRARQAQRQLDYARADRRIAAWLVVGCALLIVAVITGWWTTISWGLSGPDRANIVAGFVLGLTFLSVGVTVLTGFCLLTLWDQTESVRKADDRYQDILDEIGHDQ